MKIEKVNENQIRCTLTKEDLETRHLRLSELAYGTDKAKKLFRDMMQQAQLQFGFEADNIPLMIEAIPLTGDSVLLIITKVEDPEELDTRFSKFAPFKNIDAEELLHFDGADSIIDIFQKLCEAKNKVSGKKPSAVVPEKPDSPEPSSSEEPTVDLIQLFSFPSLDRVIQAARILNGFFDGENSLYKHSGSCDYALVLHQSESTPEEFNKLCNILSEYGAGKPFSRAGEAHLEEHGELILPHKALQQLCTL
ncbi:MAG: adaptor protein MecA [Eubacteriales bacterium]|nr:adaptor protein MecA [Eubacteriales bacterium]